MTFSTQLNEYMSLLNCSAKELADASGLSASVLSRYRNGSRLPSSDSEQFHQLTQGIAFLAKEKGLELDADEVFQCLKATLNDISFPYEVFRLNFDTLLTNLSINVADLSHFLNFDSSYISRIRNGQRRPANPHEFSKNVAKFIVTHSSETEKDAISLLLNAPINEDANSIEKVVDWLLGEHVVKEDLVIPFLSKLDAFNLDDFTRSIRFDEIKVPTTPFQLPTSRNYYGIDEMRDATIDFFKMTVLSKSKDDLIANDDTPMADKVNGTDFMKKYIFAVAMTLKKGLHVHFIHNIHRPFEEMMMGLEGWIPMYMTGQISPYYLKDVHNKLFGHFLYSSGAAALSGECIMDYHQNGKMYLTNNKTELNYYRQRALDLLSKASPLMEIYREESKDKFRAFVEKDIQTMGDRRMLLSALPIHTLSNDLLIEILEHNNVKEDDKKRIIEYADHQRNLYEKLLSNRKINVEIPLLSLEEFNAHPLYLPLSEIFYEKDIIYHYDEYLKHFKMTLEYSQNNNNYILKQNSDYPFKNIHIQIFEGKWVLISKNKAPAIHFVIYNPQLRSALEKMVLSPSNQDQEKRLTSK